MDFSLDLCEGVRLEHPLMNAAGTCKKPEEVEILSRSASSAIVLGSITLERRGGNTGNTLSHEGHFTLNSLGLPNPGATLLVIDLDKMQQTASLVERPLIVSVAGFSSEEYARLVKLIGKRASLIELNLGCPNVWGAGGEQKRIASFSPRMVEDILETIKGEYEYGKKLPNLSVKLSPFSDPFLLREVASVIAKSEIVKVVVSCNTFPNAFAWDDQKEPRPRISAANGLAGMSGPSMRPIALGQVRQLREALPQDIAIIGVGGITTGGDLRDFILAGAAAVQIATAYIQHGKSVFESILQQYLEAISL